MCRFIRGAADLEAGLVTLLQSSQVDRLSDIRQMYKVILQAVTVPTSDGLLDTVSHHGFRSIVGAVVCLIEPLARASLADLLEIPANNVHRQLQCLHALLQVPADQHAPIHPLHLSFGEYLTGPEAQIQPLKVSAPMTHSILWKQCLRLLFRPGSLHKDMCNIGCPSQLSREIFFYFVNRRLGPAMQYACRHWPCHLRESGDAVSDHSILCTFLQEHFLHWIEAMSLPNLVNEAVTGLDMFPVEAFVSYEPSSLPRTVNLITQI